MQAGALGEIEMLRITKHIIIKQGVSKTTQGTSLCEVQKMTSSQHAQVMYKKNKKIKTQLGRTSKFTIAGCSQNAAASNTHVWIYTVFTIQIAAAGC